MNRIDDLPGNLEPIYSVNHWLDLVFKSRLSDSHKLVCVVISKMCAYSRRDTAQVSIISIYTITRVLHKSQDQVQQMVNDLIRLGWIHDTGRRAGQKRVFVLTFNLLPEESKT